MSIYSTIMLTRDEAIKLIAEHVISDADDPGRVDRIFEDDGSDKLLELILFKLTDGNKHSPYHYNNFWITNNPAESTLEKVKDENCIS